MLFLVIVILSALGFKKVFKTKILGTGDMAQQLRVLAVFVEDLFLFPAPTWQLTSNCHSSFTRSNALLGDCTHVVHKHIHS